MSMSAHTTNLFRRCVTQPDVPKAVGDTFGLLAPTPAVLGAAVNTFVTALQSHIPATDPRHAEIATAAAAINARFPVYSSLNGFRDVQRLFGTVMMERVAASTLRNTIGAMGDGTVNGTPIPHVLQAVWGHIDRRAYSHLDTIDQLMRIATVSDKETLPNPAVQNGAELVQQLMQAAGLAIVHPIVMEGANPLLFGSTGYDPKKKTVVIYAHYDVQPVGTREHWQTEPHRATMLNGRMYGRGAADDLAGVVAALAVIEAYRFTGNGDLPVNLAVVFEGEEEIGSTNMKTLLQLLQKVEQRLNPDAVLLTDVGNLLDELPTIAITTRGIVGVTVEARTAHFASHSGAFSFVPNAYVVLASALAAMHDSRLVLNIPGLTDVQRPMPNFLARSLASAPHAALDALHRTSAGMLDGVPFVGPDVPTLEQLMWGFSQLNITAWDDAAHHNGVVTPNATARMSFRVPPGVDANALLTAFTTRLRAVALPGAQITVTPLHAVQPWAGDVEGSNPLTPLLGQAMTMGYGRESLFAGSGGTIGFFDPFERAFPRAVMYGLGVEDPDTRAHAPNESLGLGNLFGTARGIAAFVHLMGEHR